MSENLEVYAPGTVSGSISRQSINTSVETSGNVPKLDPATTMPLQDLIDTYSPRQIMLALGNAMYATAQEELNSAGDDQVKQQQAYLKLSQADRMRNLSVQF